MAFVMAIVWLNLEANEIVSVLRAFGLLLNVDTGENDYKSQKLVLLFSFTCAIIKYFSYTRAHCVGTWQLCS